MNSIRLLPSLLGEVFKDPRSAKDRAMRALVRDIMDGRLRAALLWTLFHMLSVYIGYQIIGETHLVTSATTFVYYYVTTGSSIGYGDLAPLTENGRLFFTYWVAPGSLATFAFILTKLLGSLALLVRQFMNGLGNFENAHNHFVIIGYIPGETEKLLAETKVAREGNETVVVTTLESLPLPDHISRVRATSLHNKEDLIRAGIKGADTVVIMMRDDNRATATCLAVNAIKTDAHVVAFFDDEEQKDLVEPSCSPNFTFLVSSNVCQVSREVVDPGAGEVLAQLSSINNGATMGKIDYAGPDTTIAEIRQKLEDRNANLLGYCCDRDKTPILTFRSDTRIGKEHTIIYVANGRLDLGCFEAA